MLEFTRLKNNLKQSADGFAGVRLAVLCDYSSQHLHIALKGYGMDRRLALNIYESDYDQVEQEVFDETSGLYAFTPEFILLSNGSHKLLDEFYATPPENRNGFAEWKLALIRNLLSILATRTKATVILTNFVELNDAVFGNFAANVRASFLYQVRKLNFLLMEEAQRRTGLLIADVQSLAMVCGLKNAIDQRNLLKADMPWSLTFLPKLAKTVVAMVEAGKGRVRKCIILDLDNTLWGGIIGDDGLEGIQLGDLGFGKVFSRLQRWVKELKGRGVIVCICSKNDERIAKEVFEKHPERVLRLEDIAVFAANWNNKVDNIHTIKNSLNIGFDSMVFVDDNPFERGMVKEAIPELEVPELPADPVDYLPFLQSLNLFETVSYTEEDVQRTALYRQAGERAALQNIYKNENDFLQGLHMKAEVKRLDAYTVPRAAQLSQRSNQFNLRTVRYNEAELHALAVSPENTAFSVSLKDRFGEYGIISFVVLQKRSSELFIENWMMSCRVLKRGVEEFVLNVIVAAAKDVGCKRVVGEYLPTAKNGLVKDHYKNLGFTSQGGMWFLDAETFEERKTFIYFAPRQATENASA